MIELALLPQHLQLEPGGLTRATVTLHAADAPAATYGLAIHGLEEGWYTLSVPEVPVAPQSDGQAVLTLHPPLEVGRGVYPFELIAGNADDPALGGRIEALLVIEISDAGATAAAVPVGVARVAAQPPSRRATLIAVAAVAALLLCAGLVYALGKRSSSSHPAAPRCAAPSAATCTPTPRITGDSGSASRTPSPDLTGQPGSTPGAPRGSETPAANGTLPRPQSTTVGAHTPAPGSAHPTPSGAGHGAQAPTTGSVPGHGHGHGTPPARIATAATPSPATSPAPLSPSIRPMPPHGITFPGLPGSPPQPGRRGGAAVPPTASAGTPTTSPTATETATGTATESPTAGSTATPTVTATPTPTATLVPIPLTATTPPTATPLPPTPATPTVTATTRPTATTVPTVTPLPTATPLPATATPPPTATTPPTATAGPSPTPAIVRLQYSYEIVDNQFSLKWLTENATSLTVDGQQETVPSGSQGYPLQTHPYELIATGADGSRQIKVVAVVVVGDCDVTVNGLQTTVQSDHCRLLQQSQSHPSPTATIAVAPTAVPITPGSSPTALLTPAVPADAFPTETPAVTYTPAPSDTPTAMPTASPTSTPTPAPSTPGQDTPVGGI